MTGRIRRFLLGTGANVLAQLLNAAGQWLLVPLFLARWGGALYGEWLMLAAAVSYASMLDLGLQTYVVNRLNQHHSRDEREEYLRVLHSALLWSLSLCAAALAAAAVALYALPFETWFNFTLTSHPVAALTAFVLAAEILASIPAALLMGLYRTVGEYPRGVMLANAQQAVFVILTAVALVTGGGLRTVALVQVVPLATGSLFAWVDLRRRRPELDLGFRKADARLALTLLAPSVLFFLIQFSMGLTIQGTTLLAGALFGAAAVAGFAVHRTLANAIRQLYGMLSHALWPELTTLEAQGRRETLREVLMLSAKGLTLTAVCAAVFLHFSGRDLVALWTGSRVAYDSRLMDGFLSLVVLQTPWLACSTLLMAANRHRALALCHLASGSIGLLAAWLFAPSLGLIGIPLGLLVADAAICLTWVPVQACREIGLPARNFYSGVLARGLLVSAAVFTAAYALQPVVAALPVFSRLAALAVTVAATGLFAGAALWFNAPESARLLAIASSLLGRTSVAHWTPRYALNRGREYLYRRANPDSPWLTPEANHLLSEFLSPRHRGLEFGSGRSTLWFARRLGALTSVEHNASWHAFIEKSLSEAGHSHVDYLLREDGPTYVNVAAAFPPESLDFVLVDGVQRDACAVAVVDKVRSGGVIVVDNANWNLPHRTSSPASRTPEQGPATAGWAQFLAAVKDWRQVWTSNGVTDTALYFKP